MYSRENLDISYPHKQEETNVIIDSVIRRRAGGQVETVAPLVSCTSVLTDDEE